MCVCLTLHTISFSLCYVLSHHFVCVLTSQIMLVLLHKQSVDLFRFNVIVNSEDYLKDGTFRHLIITCATHMRQKSYTTSKND